MRSLSDAEDTDQNDYKPTSKYATKGSIFISSLLGITSTIKKLLHICGILLKYFLCRALAFFLP